MTKSNNKTLARKGKRAQNPLLKRGMKLKMSARNVKFDGQFGNFRSVKTQAVTATNVYSSFGYVDCTTSSAMGAIGSSIANLYTTYVYESLVYRWLPSVAPGSTDAGSQIYIGYIDNPEQMVGYTADTAVNNVLQLKSMKNAKFFNAWESFTYSVPLTRRRNAFDVNITVTHTADTDDRSCQGMVLYCAESVSAAATLGRWVVDAEVKLMGLNTFTT